jgi:hypothetical protein
MEELPPKELNGEDAKDRKNDEKKQDELPYRLH